MYLAGDSREVAAKKSIFGALTLYLDFINMFLFILRLFEPRVGSVSPKFYKNSVCTGDGVDVIFLLGFVLRNRNSSGACAACITIVRVVFMSNAVSRPMSCLSAKFKSFHLRGHYVRLL